MLINDKIDGCALCNAKFHGIRTKDSLLFVELLTEHGRDRISMQCDPANHATPPKNILNAFK